MKKIIDHFIKICFYLSIIGFSASLILHILFLLGLYKNEDAIFTKIIMGLAGIIHLTAILVLNKNSSNDFKGLNIIKLFRSFFSNLPKKLFFPCIVIFYYGIFFVPYIWYTEHAEFQKFHISVIPATLISFFTFSFGVLYPAQKQSN